MVKKATSGLLVLLLLTGAFAFNWPVAKAQTATPSQAVITVSGVPTGTQSLAVEVTVDTSVVTLGSATSSVSGALVVVGSMSEGIGIISTSGDLPATFTITVPVTGVAAGMSALTIGGVKDKIGGTAITGASAAADAASVTVASSSSTTSSTSSSTGGAGGTLSADTITITINGDAVNGPTGLNVTLAFSDSAVVTLDTGLTFMGTGATQLLTDVNAASGILTAVWSGTITDGAAVLTVMLKPGSKAGTTNISVSKVEASGGADITSSTAATVSPSSVTNSAASAGGDCGTFTLIGPDSVTGPGKAAISFAVSDAASDLSATLNGASVDLVGGKTAGVALVTIPASGDLALSLSAMCGGKTQTANLGSVTVDAGSGAKPKVNSASANNKSTKTKLVVTGKKFSKTDTTIEIVPTDRAPSADPVVKGSSLKATYDSSDCIPNGSYINVTTPGGISGKKIKVHGSCSNSLVE